MIESNLGSYISGLACDDEIDTGETFLNAQVLPRLKADRNAYEVT